jgi:hypothetical protein
MAPKKLSILVKILSLCVKYSYLLTTQDFQSCLAECKKKGFLSNLNDVAFADRTLRRLFRYFRPRSPCLVHSLSLAQATQDSLGLYIVANKKDMAPHHAYVKYQQCLFSTAKVNDEAASLLIWSK